MADAGDLEVGDQIAARRAAEMPCLCDATDGTEIIGGRPGRLEHVRCSSCSRCWLRIWTHGVRE